MSTNEMTNHKHRFEEITRKHTNTHTNTHIHILVECPSDIWTLTIQPVVCVWSVDVRSSHLEEREIDSK